MIEDRSMVERIINFRELSEQNEGFDDEKKRFVI